MKITIYIHEKDLYKFNNLLKTKKSIDQETDSDVRTLLSLSLEEDERVFKYTLAQKDGFSAAVTIEYSDFLKLVDSGLLKRKFS